MPVGSHGILSDQHNFPFYDVSKSREGGCFIYIIDHVPYILWVFEQISLGKESRPRSDAAVGGV